jgi:beta-lactam-binding protein with PASTA domain
MTDDLDAICAEYMARLEAALSGLSPGDRQQIVEQVSEHIASARAALPEQTEAGVRDILERLGPPEEIAAVARTEEHSLERQGRLSLLIAGGVAVVLVVLGLGLAAAAGAFSGVGTTTTTLGSSTATTGSLPGQPSAVTVPELEGNQLTSGTQLLQAAGLGFTVRYVASDQPVGIVLAQTPTGGSAVKEGTKVALTVSGTQSAVTVPNVIGESQADAQATLAQIGLNVTVVGPVANDQVAAGVVFAQAPAAGSRIPPMSGVSIKVSAGPTATSTQQTTSCAPITVFGNSRTTSTIPCPNATETIFNVVGWYTPTGAAELSRTGLAMAVENLHSQTVPGGHIVRTSPSTGAKVPARTTLVVINSQGP